jgi:predicted transcriptional regulator
MDARFRDTMALVRLSEEVKDRLDDILEKFPYLH